MLVQIPTSLLINCNILNASLTLLGGVAEYSKESCAKKNGFKDNAESTRFYKLRKKHPEINVKIFRSYEKTKKEEKELKEKIRNIKIKSNVILQKKNKEQWYKDKDSK